MKKKIYWLMASLALAFPMATFADDTKAQLCSGVSVGGAGCGTGELQGKIGQITGVLFYIVGALSVLVIILGGIRYVTSTGDATRIKQAKDTIFYGIAGLVIALLAVAIVNFTTKHI